jgi:hypothetical protein
VSATDPNNWHIVFLTRNLVLWIPAQNIGYEIGYPSITLHAIQSTRQSVYLQIEIDSELLEATVIPQDSHEVQQLYDALSQCSSLHPDVDSETEDQYGGEVVEAEWMTDDLEQGDADDVVTSGTNGFGQEYDNTAGLEIEIESHVQPGSRRPRDEIEYGEEDDAAKWRKTDN